MRQCDLALEKYFVTQTGYFRLSIAAALGMGIKDRKLLFCHGISYQIKVSIREYNYRKVYD